MSDDGEWIHEIIPKEQVEEIQSRLERVADDENVIFNLVLSAPRSSAIELCRTFARATAGQVSETHRIINFVANIIYLIEEELYADGINPYDDYTD